MMIFHAIILFHWLRLILDSCRLSNFEFPKTNVQLEDVSYLRPFRVSSKKCSMAEHCK